MMCRKTISAVILFCGFIAFPVMLKSQGYRGPLNVHGLEKNTLHSAASRAMGGITLGTRNNIGVMFYNPAALISLEQSQISVSGQQFENERSQEQHFAPVRYYSNFSLLMENRTGNIPDPDPLLGGSTQADTVQRPYDDIRPEWSSKSTNTNVLHGLVAAPLSLGTMKIVLGAGVVQYADLNYYYQNNNVLTPNVLAQRPLPTFRPADNDPVEVYWSRFTQSREGVLRGYGASISVGSQDGEFSFGLSSLIISGTTDDLEQHTGRGMLTFYANSFRLDSVFGYQKIAGTSDYRGQEFTFSSLYKTQNLSMGITVKFPTTITRKYTNEFFIPVFPTDINIVTSRVEGEDRIELPWRGTVSLALFPRDNLMLGFEYEARPYASATYSPDEGKDSTPWLSSSVFHVGAEYQAVNWLALRMGVRGEAEVFQPDGNPLDGTPVTFSVFSAGVGLFYAGVYLDITYEHSVMKYQDIWGSAVSKNSRRQNVFIADLRYEIPWKW